MVSAYLPEIKVSYMSYAHLIYTKSKSKSTTYPQVLIHSCLCITMGLYYVGVELLNNRLYARNILYAGDNSITCYVSVALVGIDWRDRIISNRSLLGKYAVVICTSNTQTN